MNIFQALFKTSIGKKIVMAVTGLILVGYVIGHLVGNLQIFSPPEKINAYAHFLQSLGPTLWAIRAFLLLVVVLHIWMAVLLVIENKRARGAKDYENQRTLRASYASRTMRYSGLIVLVFIIYHLMHFTTKTTHAGEGDYYYPTTELHGETVADVHTMMVRGFQEPLVSTFYLIGVALLSWHLFHGFSSMFQSVGLRSRTWTGFLNKAALIFSILYFLGNAAIVGAVWSGAVKVQNEKLLAQSQPCMSDCAECESTNVR